MKQYTFKDGTKVIASSVEEAKAQHNLLENTRNPESIQRESQSKIYVKVEGSTDDDDYDIGSWKGGQLVDVDFGFTTGYGKRMYIHIRDLDDGCIWKLEFDRFVNVKVFLKLSDLDLETKEITNTLDFILTEDNMEELKKMIDDYKV